MKDSRERPYSSVHYHILLSVLNKCSDDELMELINDDQELLSMVGMCYTEDGRSIIRDEDFPQKLRVNITTTLRNNIRAYWKW